MSNVHWKDADLALKMIADRTGDLGGGYSYAERLQRLLDLPCEICDGGNGVIRLKRLLQRAIEALEDTTGGVGLMETDLADKIGITQEEYDEIM